jgi:hypothetical protein
MQHIRETPREPIAAPDPGKADQLLLDPLSGRRLP